MLLYLRRRVPVNIHVLIYIYIYIYIYKALQINRPPWYPITQNVNK